MHALCPRSLIVVVSAGLLFASSPASARGFGGHALAAPHAIMEPQSSGAMTAIQSPGSHSGHHPGKPLSGGSAGSSTSSSSAGVVIEQSTPATTSSGTPVTANTSRNPALTGGTDPAIGQSSPPVPDVFASGGGTAAVDHSGGGANTLASCMSFWDSATHMSKSEWRDTCVRTLNGIDLPADGGMTVPTSARAHVRHTRTRTQAAQ